MAIQWLSAAAFLYTEIGISLLLSITFISNQRWQSMFTSRLMNLVKTYGNFYFSAFVLILGLLFADSVNSVRKYSIKEEAATDLKNNPMSEVHMQMKLFRAQRNLYISGFSLLLLLVIRRLVQLISSQATLEASHEAMTKQAKGASEQCRKLMEENAQLTRGNRSAAASDVDNEDEKKALQDQLKKAQGELDASVKKQEKAERDLEAMKSQAEGLHREYDRIASEHSQLTKKVQILGGGKDNAAGVREDTKKDD